MPHIHTSPGQIDYIAEVFVVYGDKVLIRLHDKHHVWIAPGGHIELDETPEEAAVREVKEEVGLNVVLWQGNVKPAEGKVGIQNYRQLIPPVFMNIHSVGKDHRHISLVYFGTAETDVIVQPDNHEKAECRWLTAAEVEADPVIAPVIKTYALEALRCLGTS